MSYTVTVSLQDIWLILSSYQNGNTIQKLLRGGDDDMAFCFLMDWAKLRRWNTCKSKAGRGSCRYFRFTGTLSSHSVQEYFLSIAYKPNKSTRRWNYITSWQTQLHPLLHQGQSLTGKTQSILSVFPGSPSLSPASVSLWDASSQSEPIQKGSLLPYGKLG